MAVDLTIHRIATGKGPTMRRVGIDGRRLAMGVVVASLFAGGWPGCAAGPAVPAEDDDGDDGSGGEAGSGGDGGGGDQTCPGATECNGACVDSDFDPQNCGACGVACAPTELCSQGTCGDACSGGTTQ